MIWIPFKFSAYTRIVIIHEKVYWSRRNIFKFSAYTRIVTIHDRFEFVDNFHSITDICNENV